MGGQACVAYGGAEFSRDVDVAIAADARNLVRLKAALKELDAEPVYVPPLGLAALRRGHACHFRCHAEGLLGMRLDVMSAMRGVEKFPSLWKRRTEVPHPDGGVITLLGLHDLVLAKKTQRDKDWPMIRRLVDSAILGHRGRPIPGQVEFWLRECRTPAILLDLARRHRRAAIRISKLRPAAGAAVDGRIDALEAMLRVEEDEERREDRKYWEPLKRELEAMRLGRR